MNSKRQDLTLYGYFRSSASYRVRIALGFKQLKYQYEAVHLLKDQQLSEEFVKLNPMGEVPCLIHSGRAIAQSMAIFQYLEDVFGGPKLFPRDPFLKAQVIQFCENINAGIHPVQNRKVQAALGIRFQANADQKKDWAAYWIHRGFISLEKILSLTAGTYCFGGQPTSADMFLIPQVFNAERFGVPLTEFPNIARINKTCLALDFFQIAHPSEQPDKA